MHTEAESDAISKISIWKRLVVGLSVFFVTTIIGLVITVLHIRSIPLEVPNPTEPQETLGDFADTIFRLVFGTCLSLIVGHVAAAVAVYRMVSRNQSKKGETTP